MNTETEKTFLRLKFRTYDEIDAEVVRRHNCKETITDAVFELHEEYGLAEAVSNPHVRFITQKKALRGVLLIGSNQV